MKLVDNRNDVEVYDLENGYQVAKECFAWIPRGYKLCFYPDRSNKYLPDVYDCVERKETGGSEAEFTFRIQTTSYGSLPPEEIREVMAGYQAALDAIRMVEEVFTRKKL